VLIAMQYCMDVSPAMRANVDFVFLTSIPGPNDRKKIWENWSGCTPNVKVFGKLMDVITKDFGVMIIDCKGQTVRDSIFNYKADLALSKRRFRMGNSRYWAFAAAATRGRNGAGGFNIRGGGGGGTAGRKALLGKRKRFPQQDAETDKRLRTPRRDAELSVRLLK
jgi:hypothetical protein